jgi:hypothetical protein
MFSASQWALAPSLGPLLLLLLPPVCILAQQHGLSCDLGMHPTAAVPFFTCSSYSMSKSCQVSRSGWNPGGGMSMHPSLSRYATFVMPRATNPLEDLEAAENRASGRVRMDRPTALTTLHVANSLSCIPAACGCAATSQVLCQYCVVSVAAFHDSVSYLTSAQVQCLSYSRVTHPKITTRVGDCRDAELAQPTSNWPGCFVMKPNASWPSAVSPILQMPCLNAQRMQAVTRTPALLLLLCVCICHKQVSIRPWDTSTVMPRDSSSHPGIHTAGRCGCVHLYSKVQPVQFPAW